MSEVDEFEAAVEKLIAQPIDDYSSDELRRLLIVIDKLDKWTDW